MAHSHCTNTYIAVSRPGAAAETITSGTDKSVPYDYRFKFRQNRYICQQCSAYGADIITPHLPQAVFQRRVSTDTDTVFASARPESADKTITRGTDKSVPYKVRSKTQQRTCVTRSDMVSSIVSTPGYQRYAYQCKLNSPLKKREATTVSSAPSNRATAINVSVGASMRLRKIFDEFAGLIDDAGV